MPDAFSGDLSVAASEFVPRGFGGPAQQPQGGAVHQQQEIPPHLQSYELVSWKGQAFNEKSDLGNDGS